MPRIPELADAEATPEQTALFEGDRARYGDVLNPTRIYAYRPGISPGLERSRISLGREGWGRFDMLAPIMLIDSSEWFDLIRPESLGAAEMVRAARADSAAAG